MYKRQIAESLKKSMKQYPAVTVTGPRQSGKTTLAKETFPNFDYVLLEDPDTLEFAENDPRGFLNKHNEHVIFDEIQNAPHLFSYLQGKIDENEKAGRYILSGSQQFSLNEKISQSLAGRTALLRLLPLSLSELENRPSQTYWSEKKLNDGMKKPKHSCYDIMLQGMYPRLHKNNISPTEFYRDYVDTYVTRDLRKLLEVNNLSKFMTFLRLIAGRSGQLVNLQSLGNDAGVDHTTVKRWLSILETSYIIFLLQPHHKNFNKRLIKAPKLFFLDTGLMCYLLRIKNVDELQHHPLIGSIFETFIFTELYKNFSHSNEKLPLYFWRDRTGNEVDFLIDRGLDLLPIEVKSSQTLSSSLLKNIKHWLSLKDNSQKNGALIYGGNEWRLSENIQTIPWYGIS